MALSHKMISDERAREKAQREAEGRQDELDEQLEAKLLRRLQAADRRGRSIRLRSFRQLKRMRSNVPRQATSQPSISTAAPKISFWTRALAVR